MSGEWSEMFPRGRHIYYEGDDPEGFRQTLIKEFNFDPGTDPSWGVTIEGDTPDEESEEDDLDELERGEVEENAEIVRENFGDFTSYGFHCPANILDAVYGSERFPMGS